MDTATLLGAIDFAAFQAADRMRLQAEIADYDHQARNYAELGHVSTSLTFVALAADRRAQIAAMAPPTPTAPTTPPEAA